MYADKLLICRACKKQFTFTAGEQRFYAEHGYTEPQRCKECRVVYKQRRKELSDLKQRLKDTCDFRDCFIRGSDCWREQNMKARDIERAVWDLEIELGLH
ncbi:MAG: zinc-ribbon domain-containing protein [Oscillospiraceae bacterium]|nr:zinc-ribbon domain-containing protein [Oscillospiraceae bacterium]